MHCCGQAGNETFVDETFTGVSLVSTVADQSQRFVGRTAYLRELSARLALAAESEGDFVLLRGRRQVGKSRLITEFLARSGAHSVYFQAARRPARQELASFTE